MSDENEIADMARVNVPLDPSYAQFRDQTRFWIQRVAVPLIMVVGLFGNLITVIIMTRRRMRSTTNMYLAALALVDMLYLVLTFVLGLSHYPNMVERGYYLYWQLRPFLMMLTDACSNTSVWLTVTFTIERFIAVKYPMKGKVWCTEARAKKLIVFVFLFGVLFASPVPFEWKVVEKPANREQAKQLQSTIASDVANSQSSASFSFAGDEVGVAKSPAGDRNPGSFRLEEDNQEQPYQTSDHESIDEVIYILSLENTDFGRNETYKTIYYWSTAVIFYFIPLLSLTFFNGFLILSVHRSFRERKRMTTGQRASTKNQTVRGLPKNLKSREARGKRESPKSRQNRLVIPRIEIDSKQIGSIDSEECETDNYQINDGEKTNRSNLLKSASQGKIIEVSHHTPPINGTCFVECSRLKSDTCRHELISGSGVEVASTDKMVRAGCDQRQENSANVDQRKINIMSNAAEILTGVHTDRRVEFNCIGDDNVDDTLNIQANCDKMDDSNRTTNVRMAVNLSGQEEPEFASVKKAPRIDYETAHANATCNAACQINQLADDDSTTASLKSLKQTQNELDNALGMSTTFGLREDAQHSRSESDLLSAGRPTPTSKVTNNNTHHSVSLEATTNISGKFHLINPVVGGGGGPTPGPNSNYDSGSGTTIHTNAPIVPVSTQERRITIMLIAVVILFLCCQIPSAAMLLYTSVREPVPNTNEHALVLAFGNIFNFLMAVNAAGNFILYSFLSKKYRKTFIILFCSCFKRNSLKPDERTRTGCHTSQQLIAHNSTSSSVFIDDASPKVNGKSRSNRWTNGKFAHTKSCSTRQSEAQTGDLTTYHVGVKDQRRDTHV